MITTTYRSPLGDIVLAADERGLTGLWFADQKHFGSTLTGDEMAVVPEEAIEGFDAESGCASMEAHCPEHAAAVGVLQRAWAWLNTYFAGREPQWTPPLHLEGSAFQHAVWVELLSIPYGQTITYGELARRLAARTGLDDGTAGACGVSADVCANAGVVAGARSDSRSDGDAGARSDGYPDGDAAARSDGYPDGDTAARSDGRSDNDAGVDANARAGAGTVVEAGVDADAGFGTDARLDGDASFEIPAALHVAPRAVGNAVSRNPVSIIVPCHRVVGARGNLIGYAGGLERKRSLLQLEGAAAV